MLPIFKIVVTFKQTNEYKREGGGEKRYMWQKMNAILRFEN